MKELKVHIIYCLFCASEFCDKNKDRRIKEEEEERREKKKRRGGKEKTESAIFRFRFFLHYLFRQSFNRSTKAPANVIGSSSLFPNAS